MVRHHAACAQDGYHKLREKIPLTVFVKIQKTLFCRDAKTEMLRKEYDYIDYTFRRT